MTLVVENCLEHVPVPEALAQIHCPLQIVEAVVVVSERPILDTVEHVAVCHGVCPANITMP